MNNLSIKHLGLVDYESTWETMKTFTDNRDESTPDEIWLLEHPPVFTQGLNGKAEHILNAGNIPVVQIDRGGQITYHGPGQLVAYVMIDLKRRGINIRQLVTALEQSVIDVLAQYDVKAESKCKAPGVYVNDAKIASVGLRVRRGCSYHGLAFNVDMVLEPFSRINPCGFQGLQMSQLRNFENSLDWEAVMTALENAIVHNLGG